MIEAPRRVEKPWGYELIWAETEHYVGKILHVAAGEALQLGVSRVPGSHTDAVAGNIAGNQLESCSS